MNSQKQQKMKQTLKGVVVSDKMQKTITIAVTRFIQHPKYKKRYKVTKKFKVHDEMRLAKMGDVVLVASCSPKSKDKNFKLVEIVKKAEAREE